MIPRYSLPEMAALFTDEARLDDWLEVELLAVEGWAEVGAVPRRGRRGGAGPGPEGRRRARRGGRRARARHRPRRGRLRRRGPGRIGAPEGSWVHYGLTSSDVVDTALCATLAQAADLLIDAGDALVSVLKARALESSTRPMAGRTHGMHAEPTTFGAKFALWCLQADRDREPPARARATRSRWGSCRARSAPTPTSTPRVEDYVCGALGLEPVPATQVIARDRHAEYLWACAAVGRDHRDDRHRDPPPGPHRGGRGRGALRRRARRAARPCPTSATRSCPSGCAAWPGCCAAICGAGLEDVALWHERDISHSSVERVVLPDACLPRLLRAAPGDRAGRRAWWSTPIGCAPT